MITPISSSARHPLKELGEIFQLMVEHAPIGILPVDDHGHILHANAYVMKSPGPEENHE